MKGSAFLTLVGLAVAALLCAPAASAKPSGQCFSSRDWSGWKASPDSKSIYIRVSVSKLFRLDLAQACPTLQWPGAHLVTKLRGSSWICSPLDLDLRVSAGRGTAIPCMVSGITPLSKDEAAALPKKLRP
jgi:Family of unknown function (DUF6491)